MTKSEPTPRTWLAEPNRHPPAQQALLAVESAGWRRTAEQVSEPYRDGRRTLTVAYEHSGRSVTLNLMGETSVNVRPHWFKPGHTVGFIAWDRLPLVMRRLLDDTRQETHDRC